MKHSVLNCTARRCLQRRHSIQSFFTGTAPTRAAATGYYAFRVECGFDVDKHGDWVRTEIYYDPCFTCGMERQFSRTSCCQWTIHRDQSCLQRNNVLPVEPVIKWRFAVYGVFRFSIRASLRRAESSIEAKQFYFPRWLGNHRCAFLLSRLGWDDDCL